MQRLIAALIAAFALVAAVAAPDVRPAAAEHTSPPASVSVPGSFNSEVGCPGDWQPECPALDLTLDAEDDVWKGRLPIPAGTWEYKAALADSWQENYGVHGQRNGPNLTLQLGAPASVAFYYDHTSHWITDDRSSVIAVVAGSFQRALGCDEDWDPSCLRSWLQDVDGDGQYAYETRAIPAGSYEAKVALGEGWDENYGAGGEPDGANIPFTVPEDGTTVTFRYDAASHVLAISAGHGQDDNVELDGLRHDSRDLLYRTPGGAVPAGTPVRLRLRTFHGDATQVLLRVWDLKSNVDRSVPMDLAATDVDCYEATLAQESCDFWEVVIENPEPNNLWYRFIVVDGADRAFYDDDTWAFDGGLGRASDAGDDVRWALMVYDPAFEAPAWMKDAVIYQVFPDRFRNGNDDNDLATGEPRYDDPVLALPWGTPPEGYCRGYEDAAASCPWRFDDTPPFWSPAVENTTGRDYHGGDLEGLDDSLEYLESLGVTAIYLNPIFDSGSNHGFDTQDYYSIDPAFGTEQDLAELLRHAEERNIRIILDGVFNHLSSDSPFFDRYHRYPTVGACESADSPYRSWFRFRAPTGDEPAVCAPSVDGGTDTFYDGWWGIDSIPVLDKSNPEVQAYFLTDPDSVARHWIAGGFAGWRLDVMDDDSFPDGYWEAFRHEVKSVDPDAVIVGELWQKEALRHLMGDRADTTMNYRLRDAVIGLLAPGTFDPKGFADSGRPIAPSEFAARLLSIQEDYPETAFRSLMNIIDSHDTERALWTLTPGPETAAAREHDKANVAAGRRALALASLIQFTVPGAPTVLYGDEVGLTGDDDPDNRRTFPWDDFKGAADPSLAAHYRKLAALRKQHAALVDGDLRILLADDAAGVVAYGRATQQEAALVLINDSEQARTVQIPVSGVLPDGASLQATYAVGTRAGVKARVRAGTVVVTMSARSGLVLTTGKVDLAPPAAPTALRVVDVHDGSVELAWDTVSGAAVYNVYRSPLRGGGYVRVNDAPVSGTTFGDGVTGDGSFHYVVRAADDRGNESTDSNEVSV